MRGIYIKITEEGGEMKKQYDISVVIRTKNERRWIGYCLQSIIDNFDNPEVIIVDNFSNDETLNLVKNFSKSPGFGNEKNKNQFIDIKVLKIKDYTPGKALNLGIKKASSEHVMILSAHCEIKKIDLKKIKEKLKIHKCVFANQIPIWNGKKIEKFFIWSHFQDKEKINMFSDLENRYFLHNAAAIYNKSILKKIPFNDKINGKEDRLWAKKLVSKKMTYLYLPNFIVNHHYTLQGNSWKYVSTRY